jgi:hypothetical protein
MTDEDTKQHSEKPPRRRLLMGLVVWPAFLAAGVGSIFFFAVVDPELLRDAGPRLFVGMSREAGYAIGFFFFWGIAAIASALSLFLTLRRGLGEQDLRGP